MKILITVDDDGADHSDDLPSEAYRMVEWPTVPRKDEDIYPFVRTDDIDRKVVGVDHFLERGYISLILEPFSGEHLTELLEKEKDEWIISTRNNPVPESQAAKKLLSS